MNSRRQILFSSMTLLPIIGYFLKKKATAYQVCFYVSIPENNPDSFFNLHRQYEDNDKINRISDAFMQNGQLLSKVKYVQEPTHLSWTYVFKNKESFDAWENSLYELGAVQQHNRPYTILRDVKSVFV